MRVATAAELFCADKPQVAVYTVPWLVHPTALKHSSRYGVQDVTNPCRRSQSYRLVAPSANQAQAKGAACERQKSKYSSASMPGNKKKNKGNKAKNAPARSNAANKDDLAGLDDLLR